MLRTRRRRTALLVLLTTALMPACGDAPTSPDPGAGGDPTDDGNGSTYRHDLGPGASAADLLSDESFRHLVVQVQYVEGLPEPEGLAHLEAFLNARLNKPTGIEIRIDAPLQIAPKAAYTDADVRALEAEHRTLYTSGDTLAAYLLFLDGEYKEQENVLGIAYNNTSTALFAEKIAQHTGGFGEPSAADVEGTVASHEFGHLMGLVNNGSEMQEPHQDEGNGHHCTNESCLMFYAVRTTDFLTNLLGGDLPTLDQSCLDDLRTNGGK